MYPYKSLILAALAVLAPAAVSGADVIRSAHCFNIAYTSDEVSAALRAAHDLPIGAIQGYPMRYPLSNLKFAWPDHGHPFPASGYPWSSRCKNTAALHKFPLLPSSMTGHDGNGRPAAWSGKTPRVSTLPNGQTQMDYVFQDDQGNFCMIATETPLGTSGWLPCAWEW